MYKEEYIKMPKGFMNEGAEIIEDVLDGVRKQVELCEALSSF